MNFLHYFLEKHKYNDIENKEKETSKYYYYLLKTSLHTLSLPQNYDYWQQATDTNPHTDVETNLT